MNKTLTILTALAGLTIASQAQTSWEENIRLNRQAGEQYRAQQAEKWRQTMEQDRQIEADRVARMKANSEERQRQLQEADEALAVQRSNTERRASENRLAEIEREGEQQKQAEAYAEQQRQAQEAEQQKTAAIRREQQLRAAAQEAQRLQEQHAEEGKQAAALDDLRAGNFKAGDKESIYEFGYRLGLAISDNLGGRKTITPEELGPLINPYGHRDNESGDFGAGVGQALVDQGVRLMP
jgi:hypothetical protein